MLPDVLLVQEAGRAGQDKEAVQMNWIYCIVLLNWMNGKWLKWTVWDFFFWLGVCFCVWVSVSGRDIEIKVHDVYSD